MQDSLEYRYSPGKSRARAATSSVSFLIILCSLLLLIGCSQPEVFACNYYADFDGNQRGRSSEFVGRKSEFNWKEKITMVACNIRVEEGESVDLKMRVFDSNGDVVKKAETTLEEPGNRYQYFALEPRSLNPGEYTVVFNIDGGLFGKTNIRVNEQ